jgi:hypothetical protein
MNTCTVQSLTSAAGVTGTMLGAHRCKMLGATRPPHSARRSTTINSRSWLRKCFGTSSTSTTSSCGGSTDTPGMVPIAFCTSIPSPRRTSGIYIALCGERGFGGGMDVAYSYDNQTNTKPAPHTTTPFILNIQPDNYSTRPRT